VTITGTQLTGATAVKLNGIISVDDAILTSPF